MTKKQHFTVSDLSVSNHSFTRYHFCRGNSNKRKTRFGLIEKGSGSYIYLNKKLDVTEGDIVYIPERVYCYSEWHGNPEIKVTYISCFMNYATDCFAYEPQILRAEPEVWDGLSEIATLLTGDFSDELLAYSVFFRLLRDILPGMTESAISTDKTLQTAISYITNNWDKLFSVKDLALHCRISESGLYHLFRKQLGQSPISFLNSIKVNQAIQFLETTDYSISEISSLSNFNSENHFRKVFTEFTGVTPSKYRKQL